MPWLPNIANKFAKTAKPFGTRVPLTLRYALAIPSVSRSVRLTFLTSPATGTKKSKFKRTCFFCFGVPGRTTFPSGKSVRKTLAFCQKRTSTFFDRKMRPRPRLRFWPTQRPCYRVSSSCTLYEVFGNFAWRSAPPRKRVTQSKKAPALRDRDVPPADGSRRGARLRGNGDRGTSVTTS